MTPTWSPAPESWIGDFVPTDPKDLLPSGYGVLPLRQLQLTTSGGGGDGSR